MKELLGELMVEPLQELVVSEPVEILEVLKNHVYISKASCNSYKDTKDAIITVVMKHID